MRMHGWRYGCCSLLLILSGCVTDATVELTKAPFDATTALANGTTNATGEILEPLTEFTSSTTPGATYDADPLMKAKRRTELFATHAYHNLRADISRGGGEYLVSLATLAGVEDERIVEFGALMQDSYGTMFDEGIPMKDSAALVVEAAWAKGHGRQRVGSE